ncbi:MAG: phosphatidylserine decarboxylase, partial [Proteobacteria bacterium]|nr:phosphatidylserine decarboxylase [Pseudomonadota bacterium]
YVPGRLFSVAPYSAEVVENLYTRNERVISIFETEIGWMAVVMVGAVNVAAIEVAWEGLVTPAKNRTLQRKKYSGLKLSKGDELGIFHMGSTAIVAFESPTVEWHPGLREQQPVKMGQLLGRAGITRPPAYEVS